MNDKLLVRQLTHKSLVIVIHYARYREKKLRRNDLLKSLSTTKISEVQASLLHRTVSMSSRMTAKERLRQELKEERAGIAVTSPNSGEKTSSVSVPR